MRYKDQLSAMQGSLLPTRDSTCIPLPYLSEPLYAKSVNGLSSGPHTLPGMQF